MRGPLLDGMDRGSDVVRLRLEVMPTGNANDLCKDIIIGLSAKYHACTNLGSNDVCHVSMKKQAMRHFKEVLKKESSAAGSRHCKELFLIANRP